MRMLIVWALLLCAYINGSQACSCMFMTVPQKYCRSDFVVEVKVTSRMINPSGSINESNAFYKVRMLKGYRQRNWYTGGTDMTRVYTAAGSHMCGVTLRRRRRYILSGYISNTGQLRLNSCSSIIDMSPWVRATAAVLVSPPSCVSLVGADMFKAAP